MSLSPRYSLAGQTSQWMCYLFPRSSASLEASYMQQVSLTRPSAFPQEVALVLL